MVRHPLVLLAMTVSLGGCQGCGPDFDPADVDDFDQTDPVGDTDPETDRPDTAPEPPCEVPETEPNNTAADAQVLPMEALACGTFGTMVDIDQWTFTLDEPGWLGVDIRAWALGSEADVSLTLSSTELDLSVGAYRYRDTPDVHLRFPSPPAAYQALIRQSLNELGGQGEGDDFFYDLIATSTKPPVSWDVDEADNDLETAPQVLVTAPTGPEPVTVFGDADAVDDPDWYEIVVPAGRHRVVLDIDAHEYGSWGDFALQVRDGDGGFVLTEEQGRQGWELDPFAELDTLGPTVLRVRVVEEDGRVGMPIWYALGVTVEAE